MTGFLTGVDADPQTVAGRLRVIADGLETGDVALTALQTTSDVSVGDTTHFGLEVRYAATADAYAPRVDHGCTLGDDDE